MTELEKKALKKQYSLVCAYFHAPIPDEVLLMYVADLEDLEFQKVMNALRDLRLQPGRMHPPRPGDVRLKCDPAREDPMTEAREIAVRIMRAISHHGQDWTGGWFGGGNGKKLYTARGGKNFETWREAAQHELGDLALEIVDRFGGWRQICEFSNESTATNFNAQIRDFAAGIIKRSKDALLAGPNAALPAPSVDPRALPDLSRASVASRSENSNLSQPEGFSKIGVVLPKIIKGDR